MNHYCYHYQKGEEKVYIYSQNQNLSELQKYEYKNEAEIQNLLFLHPEIVLELREEIPEFQFSMNIPSLVCRESPLSGCVCFDLMIITEDAVGTERLTLAGQMNCFIEVAKNIVELLQANLKVKDFVAIEYEEEKPSVLLEVIPSFGRNLNNETGYFGLLCSFTNTSNKTVRIVWNQSSLNYNGGSYSPFLSEQKFLNAAIPMAPSVI